MGIKRKDRKMTAYSNGKGWFHFPDKQINGHEINTDEVDRFNELYGQFVHDIYQQL